jgi:AraC-like DNA-binding protein
MRTGYAASDPPAPFADRVDAFWEYRTSADGDAAGPHRVLPDGCIDLIFRCRAWTGSFPRLVVYGAAARFTLPDLLPGEQVLGVRFLPGRAGPVLDVCPRSVADRELPADDGPRVLARLRDRLADCHSFEEARAAFRQAVLVMLTGRPRPHQPRTDRALALLHESEGRLRVDAVAKAVGVTERTLHRDVLAASGLPPKVLARILRFKATLARLRSGRPAPLCVLALDGGYADQAHMAREFRELSGLTPGALLKTAAH